MTDAYDELRKDWCDEGDMPRATCWHCGAHPGGPALPPLERPWSFDGVAMRRVSVFDQAGLPSTWGSRRNPVALKLRNNAEGCGCGQPTRDNAFGCDDCAGELSRFYGDVPWIAEQLDVTVTGQRGKRPGLTVFEPLDGMPWNDKASKVLHDLHAHLAGTIGLCAREHVRHQSPYLGLPEKPFKIDPMSRWLLWRVDGLTLNQRFTDTLRDALAVEKRALAVIDRAPDQMFLGMCQFAELGLCDGAVYVKAGELVGKCRECGTKYDPEDRRNALEKALDDKLCTAAEIAHLATYLGIEKAREVVRKRINGWHKRGQIKAVTVRTDDGVTELRFRYGDVAPLLSALYGTKGA